MTRTSLTWTFVMAIWSVEEHSEYINNNTNHVVSLNVECLAWTFILYYSVLRAFKDGWYRECVSKLVKLWKKLIFNNNYSRRNQSSWKPSPICYIIKARKVLAVLERSTQIFDRVLLYCNTIHTMYMNTKTTKALCKRNPPH